MQLPVDNIMHSIVTVKQYECIDYAASVVNAVSNSINLSPTLKHPNTEKFAITIQFKDLENLFLLGVLAGRKMERTGKY